MATDVLQAANGCVMTAEPAYMTCGGSRGYVLMWCCVMWQQPLHQAPKSYSINMPQGSPYTSLHLVTKSQCILGTHAMSLPCIRDRL